MAIKPEKTKNARRQRETKKKSRAGKKKGAEPRLVGVKVGER